MLLPDRMRKLLPKFRLRFSLKRKDSNYDFDGARDRDRNPRLAVRTRWAETQGHLAAPGIRTARTEALQGTMLIRMLDKRSGRWYSLNHGYDLPNEPSEVSARLSG